jgi:uncharacterized protein YkwD
VLRKKYVSAAFAGALLLFAASHAALASPQTSSRATNLLHAVNATRAAHDLGPLHFDAALARAARAHTSEMLRENVFTHGNFYGRMVSFHLTGSLGENLAWGSGSLGEAWSIVRMWLASPPHRANLLRPSYRRLGLGVATGTFQGNAGATVVTADFGG